MIMGHLLTACCGLPFMFSAMPSAESWMGLIYLGVFQQGISLALYTWAIKRLGALEAILIMTLEPIFNPILVAVGYGEIPGKWAIIGGLVVILSVTMRGVCRSCGRMFRIYGYVFIQRCLIGAQQGVLAHRWRMCWGSK